MEFLEFLFSFSVLVSNILLWNLPNIQPLKNVICFLMIDLFFIKNY